MIRPLTVTVDTAPVCSSLDSCLLISSPTRRQLAPREVTPIAVGGDAEEMLIL